MDARNVLGESQKGTPMSCWTRINQKPITCNACRMDDASGYEIRLGDPTVHNTMSVFLCRSCYWDASVVAVMKERKACALAVEDTDVETFGGPGSYECPDDGRGTLRKAAAAIRARGYAYETE